MPPGFDRGRDGAVAPPLPPNRTGRFPASGSPVDGLVAKVGTLSFRLRPGGSVRTASVRHRSSASRFLWLLRAFPTSNRFVSPLVTLPCLASGTCGSCICGLISLMLPSSYPPSLHARYAYRCYYEDSDSCPAPSSTRTGILDS